MNVNRGGESGQNWVKLGLLSWIPKRCWSTAQKPTLKIDVESDHKINMRKKISKGWGVWSPSTYTYTPSTLL